MEKLVLYQSKHGAVEEVAKRIASQCNISKVLSFNEFNQQLNNYDVIIIGDSVFAGSLSKGVKEFFTLYKDILLTKKIYLFISGLQVDGLNEVLTKNLPSELVDHLIYSDNVGGRLNFPDMNFMEKSIIKVINKKMKLIDKVDVNKNYNFLNEDKINELITKINQNS